MTILANIPIELKRLNQWVVAYPDCKAPVDPLSNQFASPSNANTWTSWKNVVYALNTTGAQYAGFVFDNPYSIEGYIGIDIDDAIDEHGELSADAQWFLENVHSYSEWSKSGKGIHIICKGVLPFTGRNNLRGVEVYRDGRYFILTGNVIDNRKTIEPVSQTIVTEIIKRFFPEVNTRRGKRSGKTAIYNVEWRAEPGKIPIIPFYPPVAEGGRHTAMVSVAGLYKSAGLSTKAILRNLVIANEQACSPPLKAGELRSIARSMRKYVR